MNASALPTPGWKLVTALLVVLPIVLWLFGYWETRSGGSDPGSARLKATAFALSGLPGCLAYWAAMGRPRSEKGARFQVWSAVGSVGWFTPVTILEPKAVPWAFPEMLRFGVVHSLVAGLLTGLLTSLMVRGWRRLSKAIEVNEARRFARPSPDRT